MRPGDVIAEKYLVIRVIASGGMGYVVAARHRQLHRVVAIRFLREGMSARAGARFEREGRVLAGLTGEHVAKVYDFGRLESGEPFIVMELLEGETLGDRIRRNGRLPAGEAVSFVLDACEGLAEAHAAGVIHRDLKPQNLFVSRRLDDKESIKIIDFGISKARESVTTLTHATDVIGTPAYMAPEQFEAAGSVDQRADVWSLGALLYEALSGRVPFGGDSVIQIVSAVLKSDPKPLTEQDPSLSPELAAAVQKCLSKDIDERFASVLDLARALIPHAPGDGTARLERIERAPRPRPSESALPVEETAEIPSRDLHLSNMETNVASVQAARPLSSRIPNGRPSLLGRRRLLGLGLATGATAGLALAATVWNRQRRRGEEPSEPIQTLPAPSESGTPTKPIKVGLLHSLTGTMASSESSFVDAVLLAIGGVERAQSGGGDAVSRDTLPRRLAEAPREAPDGLGWEWEAPR